MISRFILLLAILLTSISSFSQVVLRIDDFFLSKDKFEALFKSYWSDIFHIPVHRAGKLDRKEFLIEYARCKLILLGAAEENLTVSEEEFKTSLRERVGKRSVPEVVEELFRCELTTEKLVRELYTETEPSEEALRAYYILNKRDFYFPDRVLLLRVFVKKQGQISLVRNMLTYSDSIHIKGVTVGKPLWFSLQTLPSVIRRSLSSYEKGSVSKPIPLEGGYLVVKVLDRKKAGVLSFEEARTLIRDKIIKEYREEVLRRWLRRVAQRHQIELNLQHLY